MEIDDIVPDAEKPDAWCGGIPLNRLARFLFEQHGGQWWADPDHVSQDTRSKYFTIARTILTVGEPFPKAEQNASSVDHRVSSDISNAIEQLRITDNSAQDAGIDRASPIRARIANAILDLQLAHSAILKCILNA